jgi:tetratricopeptide (TPR) repeat protein
MRTVIALLLLLSGPALAQREPRLPERAARHLKAGIEAFERRDYDRAVEEFRAAYELAPEGRLLYSWAQAERLRGNCEEATRLYRKFLEGNTTLAQREATRAGLERCARESAHPSPPLPSEPERDEIEPVSAETLPPEPERPPRPAVRPRREAPAPDKEHDDGAGWYTDPLGAALLTTGGLCLAIGVGYTLAARQSRDAAETATQREEFTRLLDQANERRTIGTAGLIAGAAFTSGAVIRYVLRAREGRGPAVAVEEGGSLLLVWTGRF